MAFIRRWVPVVTAHPLSGDADYVLGTIVRDRTEFADFIHNHPLPHPEVAQARSETVLKTVKSADIPPLG